ncbi:hypothetical protein K6119_05765 [Paracrocinitomix mangrovi]|uniref:hypothetical protein n=1 Tax=Paracrocinitomix mangrovi TaxID=2862509 RepID=UPI001C8D8DE6|nr:hypothetical protein [Paracrocinitomix mangrovi]UKN03021.1 hypothetical protein K6119_05765 [Paracrocinitomix mangrovi]
MAVKRFEVNTLNIFLIILSLGLAYAFPFELFILAYAILGPLHYVTEINWLDKKGYFIQDRKQVWILVLLTAMIAVPFMLASVESTNSFFKDNIVFQYIRYYTPNFIFTGLTTAIVMTFTRNWMVVLGTFIGTFLLGMLLQQYLFYVYLVSGLLPTILHVFVFTFFFMLYGAIKDNSRTAYLSVILLLIVPVLISLVPYDAHGFEVNKTAYKAFEESGLQNINFALGYTLGLFENGQPFKLISDVGVKLQIFVAFAYTYHYLNWFSKTTVIGWHKVITKKKLILLLGIWVISIVVYMINYIAGFILLLFLSYLHVLMEFPLNWVSIKEVGKKIFGLKAGTA